MSEMAGTESVPDTCGVCGATSDDEPQLLGTCIDSTRCVRRWAGLVERSKLLGKDNKGIEYRGTS